jgi:hypothetical protein
MAAVKKSKACSLNEMPLSTSHYSSRVREYCVVIPLKRDTATEDENEENNQEIQ